MKVGEARGWGVDGCTDAVVLGETQLLGLHLETQALYVDETGVSVLFTHTPPGPRSTHPPPRLHSLHRSPISTSPCCLQTSLTTLVSIPSLTHRLPQPCRPLTSPPPLSLCLLCLSVSLSLTPSFHSPPPFISLGSVHCCSADEGEDIAASALIL